MAQAWFVRPYIAGDKNNYTEEFTTKGYIAVGPNGMNNPRGYTLEKIKEYVAERMGLDKLAAASVSSSINNFVNKMSVGDLVLLLDDNTVYAMRITSDYEYFQSKYVARLFLCHRRNIEVLHRYDRDMLPDKLRAALRVNRQVADISKHYEEVYKLCYDQEAVLNSTREAVKSLEVSYPLRPDYQVKFTLPADMTKEEAERLDAFIKTLYFNN